MAISGSLQLGPPGEGGENWRIVHMDYNFFQPVDRFGLPSGSPDGGSINFTVESSSGDITLIRWMLARQTMTDGGAYFFDRNGRSVRTVQFRGAYCVYYKEIFDAFDNNFMRIEFKISCGEISVNDGGAETTLVKSWRDSEGSSSSSPSSSPSSGASDSDASSAGSSEGISSFNPND